MTRQNYFFTSESVAEGHPDKVCDRISDEIVDLVYREAKKTGMDPWKVRVACETLAKGNLIVQKRVSGGTILGALVGVMEMFHDCGSPV